MSNYDVFISASSKDFAIAGEVYRFLRGHKLKVFFSEESLQQRGSADYRKVIDEAIEHTTHMVVVTSSRANAEGEWVQAEWGSFINEKRSGRKSGNLVTLFVGDLSPEKLPLSLRQYEVLHYDDVGMTKLLSYVASGTSLIESLLAKVPRAQKGKAKMAVGLVAAFLLLAALAFAWQQGFISAWTNRFIGAATTAPAPTTNQPAASQAQNPPPSSSHFEKAIVQEPPKAKIEERPQQPAPAKIEPPPAQPASAVRAPAAESQSPPAATQTAAKEQAPPLASKETVAPPPPPAPGSGPSVFINPPGINDRFVDKLLDQLRAGLSEKKQQAMASSAANYVLRWAEQPKFQREGPNGSGEYTFSISMRCEVYKQGNSQAVKSIPVHNQQTGRNEQAANILDKLISESSAKILNSLATLEQ